MQWEGVVIFPNLTAPRQPGVCTITSTPTSPSPNPACRCIRTFTHMCSHSHTLGRRPPMRPWPWAAPCCPHCPGPASAWRVGPGGGLSFWSPFCARACRALSPRGCAGNGPGPLLGAHPLGQGSALDLSLRLRPWVVQVVEPPAAFLSSQLPSFSLLPTDIHLVTNTPS